MTHCFARTSVFAEFFFETWIAPAEDVLAAVTAAEVAGRHGLRYEPLSDSEYRRRLAAHPAWLGEAYASLPDRVRAGHWAGVA